MKLNVLERLLLLGMLPKEGDLTTIRIVRELREGLSFGEAENAALEFKQDGDQLRWKDGAVEDKEFEFGAKSMSFIGDALEKLVTDEKVTEQHLCLFDKFKIE